MITGNTAVKGPLVYYLLLTYVKSNYENNYWGDINPNSTEWAEKFVTKEYTDAALETWLEKSPYDVAENTPSKNETGNGKTTGLNQKSTNEKTTANSKTNNAFSSSQNSTNEKSTASSMAVNAFSFSQNSTNEKSTTNSVAGKSANPISGHDQNSKSASYLTKKNAITNKVNSINYLNLVLIIIILMMWGYGLYRFRN